MSNRNDTEHPAYTLEFADVMCSELETISRMREERGMKSDQSDNDSLKKEIDRLNDEIENNGKRGERNRKALISEKRYQIRPSTDTGLVGLALSGGGIRSAIFNLGLLQALARRGVLRCCDYLSTVSGGGYIGSCLSSLLNASENQGVSSDNFPFRFERDKKSDERKEMKHLRRHSKYLAPNKGVIGNGAWRMIGTYLTGLVLTNLFPFGIVLLFSVAAYHISINKVIGIVHLPKLILFVFFGIIVFLIVIRAIWACKPKLNLEIRNRLGTVLAIGSMAAFFLGLFGVIILLAEYLPQVKSKVYALVHGISIGALLSLLTGLVKVENKALKKLISAAFSIALFSILPLVFAQILHVLVLLGSLKITLGPIPVLVIIALAMIILSCIIDTNRITIHHFYRDRLSEAFIIKREKADSPVESNEELTLTEMENNKNGPYHLINTALNIPSSTNRYARGRGDDLFIFSQNYCGSMVTGYRRTKEYNSGETRLATAMAISGAAVSPQMGDKITNPLICFMFTLLNIRLNRWMPNPFYEIHVVPLWPYYFLKELFSRGRETDHLCNLSDGGHYENLGTYPLFQRRCKYIIASDAGQDPAFKMADLANTLRKARIDFGIDIDIDLTGLRPKPCEVDDSMQCTPMYYAIGRIRYPENAGDESKENSEDGYLLLIKSSMKGTENEDLLSYRRENPTFPDQTTGDQFFDEGQFESYRKLGEIVGKDIFRSKEVSSVKSLGNDEISPADIENLFKELYDRYMADCEKIKNKGY